MTYQSQAGRGKPEALLKVLSTATFVIFFQAYMVAPLIPRLATIFSALVSQAGLIVPAYLIPYGVATLIYSFLADRIGIWRIMMISLMAFAVLAALTATADSIEALALWRAVTGLGASGVVPLALVLVGRLYPYEKRGGPLGWLFGAMAGGMGAGSSLGAMLEPLVSWRGIFLGTSIAGAGVLFLLLPHKQVVVGATRPVIGRFGDLLRTYKSLLGSPRGARTYGFVFLNSIFHAGIFTWLGFYLEQRFYLGPVGIGLALLGYGVPGFVLGPVIGRAADRLGRGRLIPIGLTIGASAAAGLALDIPLAAAAVAITLLSLGYDMTQPLFAGIISALGGERAGQAMGLNVFLLFTGFGLGSLIFGQLLQQGMTAALLMFGGLAIALALLSTLFFKGEVPKSAE